MSNLITNIRKASLPLQESSAQLGRLLLQLGYAADSQLDAETLAELDKQASVAACQALEAAAAAEAAGADNNGEAAGDAPKPEGEKSDEAAAEAAVSAVPADASGGGNAEDGGEEVEKERGVREESSTTTTGQLSADSSHFEDPSSNNSSSHHHNHSLHPDSSHKGDNGDPAATATAGGGAPSSSLMHALSSVHSAGSSPRGPMGPPSASPSSRHGAPAGAPSPLPRPRSARSSREPSLHLPGGILAAAKESPASAAVDGGSAASAAPARKQSTDGPVTVVLSGFDMEGDDKLVVCESRALAHLFTRIRNRDTPPQAFRFYAGRMMRILAEEGIACLQSFRQFITTPTAATFSSVFIDESNVCVVSILRAGDALAEAAQACIPTAPVGKILIQRDEESRDKHPVLFYKKLPPKIATMQVLLCDPMLATGGSALMAIRCLMEAGVKESAVVFVTVVVCPEGLGAVRAEFPEVTIVTGAIDDCLDERRYILPGLGDFGDRFFGTVP
ncbi:unnamed protein product [Scytosiphon promiscuus]